MKNNIKIKHIEKYTHLPQRNKCAFWEQFPFFDHPAAY